MAGIDVESSAQFSVLSGMIDCVGSTNMLTQLI